MKKFNKSELGFHLPFEAYYAEAYVIPIHHYEYIMVGFYSAEGGTEGEFSIEFDDVGIQLKAYEDSWEALSHMPELLELMAKIDREGLQPTINEFAEMLRNIGYTDLTLRERRY